MRVCVVSGYYLPHKGGIETFIANLSAIPGVDFSVVSSSFGGVSLDSRVTQVKAFRFMKCPISFSLFFRLFSIKTDLFYINFPHPFFFEVAALVAKLRRIPYIVHCHGKEVEYTGFFGWITSIYNTLFYDIVLAGASKIVVNTSKVILQSRYLRKYTSKIEVIPHGVKDVTVDKIAKKFERMILFVGALRDYKKVDDLINAVSGLDCNLVIVGDGDCKQNLVKLVSDLGLNNIHFIGNVGSSELNKYYSMCDVFVLPSNDISESFGLVAFEAGIFGKPCIVRKGAGVSEVFEKEKIGIVCDSVDSLKNSIVKILDDKEYASYVGNGLRSVLLNKYAWDKIYPSYMRLFEDVRKA